MCHISWSEDEHANRPGSVVDGQHINETNKIPLRTKVPTLSVMLNLSNLNNSPKRHGNCSLDLKLSRKC